MPLVIPNDIANGQFIDGDKHGQNYSTIENWANQEAITRDGSTAMTGPLLLAGPPTQPNQAATKEYADSSGAFVSEMRMYGGDTAPNASWMLCQGQAISRTTYATLFGVIGIRYGPGDSSTTFNLPDMRGQYGCGAGGAYGTAVGAKFGTKDSILPSHGHGGLTGVDDRDHYHPVNGQTDDQGSHIHPLVPGGATFVGATINPSGVIGNGGAQIAQINFYDNTGAAGVHRHNLSLNSGGRNTGHYHPIPLEGVSAVNGNLPPSVSVNFIMKVA